MSAINLRPLGAKALLAELPSLEAAMALFEQLQLARPLGVGDLVPAARTVLIHYDPYLITAAALSDHVKALDLAPRTAHSGREIEIPVHYDGEDLPWVAEHLGLTIPEVIARHEAAHFTAAFSGFAPGFCYLKCSDAGLHLPRRPSPRVRIPAGSVAMAGEFGGIYPSDSPGGWQLLGHTPLKMWDLSRSEPALIRAGDRLRFRDIAKGAKATVISSGRTAPQSNQGSIEILRSDRPLLLQDLGRFGLTAEGISQAGAMDCGALIAANRALGNARDEAALEIAFGGVILRVDEPLTFALSGAPCPLQIIRSDGQKISLPQGGAIALDAGDQLSIAAPETGSYSYLALRGGYDVAKVLGSRSYDTLAKLGPLPIGKGEKLRPAHRPTTACAPLAPRALPKDEIITLDVIEGPRADWFTDQALATLYGQDWTVALESDRSGKRLSGPKPLERRDSAELPSEGTMRGALQVPHSGQPVLFLADHPLTGGYPVIAVIAPYHLDLAAQVPPLSKIRFRPISLCD